MYLHLGQEIVIKTDDIVGIFDLEKTTVSKRTKEFLVEATHRDEVVTVSYEMPKSFVVTNNRENTKSKKDSDNNKVYISQISTATLKKRMKQG